MVANLRTLGEGSLLSQLERNLRFPRTSAVLVLVFFFFQHRNIRQARGTLICRIYTNSQSHASIFVSPANKFSASKNTHIYLDQKKLKSSLQWALRERYGDERRQHKFKFWRKLPSTAKHQMQLFR